MINFEDEILSEGGGSVTELGFRIATVAMYVGQNWSVFDIFIAKAS